jgi:hypothetical protein
MKGLQISLKWCERLAKMPLTGALLEPLGLRAELFPGLMDKFCLCKALAAVKCHPTFVPPHFGVHLILMKCSSPAFSREKKVCKSMLKT